MDISMNLSKGINLIICSLIVNLIICFFFFVVISRSILQRKTNFEIQSKGVLLSLCTLTRAGAASARCIDTRAKGNSKACKDCKRCGREQQVRGQQWLQSAFAAPPWDQSCRHNGGHGGTNHHFELLQAFSDRHSQAIPTYLAVDGCTVMPSYTSGKSRGWSKWTDGSKP